LIVKNIKKNRTNNDDDKIKKKYIEIVR
jgi:hypothetical protein